MNYKSISINDISLQDYQYFYSLVSSDKKKRIDRFRFEDDKKRTIAGEILARKMIADCCNIGIESIEFYTNKLGKPFVKDLDIEFSISHSSDRVLCAISSNPIGVDIEKIRKIDDSVIFRVCTENEIEYVFNKTISTTEKVKRFLEIWTFKEAYFKCLGTGIKDLKSIDCFGNNCFCHKHEILDNYVMSICWFN